MMSAPATQLRSQRGFTLLEIVMALGLAGLVSVAVFTFYTTFTKSIFQLSDEIEVSQDLESGQRIMLRDLKLMDPSFGVVTVEDDFSKPFFEVFNDLPEDELDASIKVNDPKDPTHPFKRQVTLKAGGRTEITLLLHDTNAHSFATLNYDPSWAYAMLSKADWSGTPGNVEYRHVNWVKPAPNGHPAMISSMRPAEYVGGKKVRNGYWNKGQLLMFDMPAVFRSPAQITERNKYAPRPPFFVGRVAGNNTDAAFNIDPEVRKIVNTTHPITPTYDILSAHDFLWGLPSVAGGMPTVRLRPVKLVKYYVEEMYPDEKTKAKPDPKRLGLVRLFRWVYTDGKWDKNVNHFMIAEKLKALQFRRNSVTTKAVLFDFSKQDL